MSSITSQRRGFNSDITLHLCVFCVNFKVGPYFPYPVKVVHALMYDSANMIKQRDWSIDNGKIGGFT